MVASNWISQLSDWYLRHARVLPWRKTRDAYSIWISEVMLQQTQVATVIPYYHRFLESFPTLEALAAAKEPDVLTRWSGLGYYSRAKNLHKGAKFLVEQCAGSFPRERTALLEVSGIGPYTAGAILSIAFNLPEPLVDGNVQRVFSRFFGVRDSISLGATKQKFWEKATEAVARCDSPRIFNQALMELGAIICTKGKPRCQLCPVSEHCIALKKGWQEELPIKQAPKSKIDLWWIGLVADHQGKLLLKQNAKGEWWSDLWDFPRLEVPEFKLIPGHMDRWAKSRKITFSRLAELKHTVTHHRIRVAPYLLEVSNRARLKELGGDWFSYEQIKSLPLSSLAKKVLGSLPVIE